MLGPLIKLVVGAGIPERFAKAVSIAALVIAGILGLGIAKCTYDRGVVARATSGQAAAVATGARAADHAADAAAAARDAARAAQSNSLQGAIDNASQAQPDAVRRPAGSATNGVLDELRRQQRAAGGR